MMDFVSSSVICACSVVAGFASNRKNTQGIRTIASRDYIYGFSEDGQGWFPSEPGSCWLLLAAADCWLLLAAAGCWLLLAAAG